MTNMEKLLDELKETELEMPRLEEFERYLIPADDKSVWKNRKKYAIVNEFYAVKFELWKDRLIERIFYVNQYWENKVKHYYDIFEVQRFLAGSRHKLNRGIYMPSFAGVPRPVYWKDYRECLWTTGSIDTKRCDTQGWGYIRAIDTVFLNSYQYLLKQSVHKYCGFEYSGLHRSELFWFLELYERHPQMEMIVKMGLMDIVRGSMNCLRWSQKGFRILGLESWDEVEKVKMCGKLGGLKYYRRHREDIRRLKIESAHELAIYDVLHSRRLPKITRKMIDYIAKADAERGMFYYGYTPTAPLYIDYIDFCNRLGIPLSSKIKYPADLRTAHDELQNRIEIVNSKAKTEKIQKQVIEELFKYRYANDEFVITPANSVEDLINESRELNHCVRTYADRYAAGMTTIFLIRKRDDVMTPFYTLELKNSKVNQVRGSMNCDPDENVRSFVTGWCKKYKLDPKIYQGY